MMSNYLSRYSPKYIRSLVYMLQASEYNISAYLTWYNRTKDFEHVEKRKKLDKTKKAMTLLVGTWCIEIVFYILALIIVFEVQSNLRYLYFILIVLAIPFILTYLLVALIIIVKSVQIPVESFIVKQAHKKLKSYKGLKIAIAGSYGKTSMREILKTVLSESKKVAAPPHSYNTPLSISKFIKGLKGDEDVLIFEFGEYYPGDVMRLCHIVQPDVGIITGINEAHLEKFKTLGSTAKTIFELADWLGAKPVYVNAESKLVKNHALSNHILYSREGLDSWKVKGARTGLDGTYFKLSDGRTTLDLKSDLLGMHQVGPLAVAAHVALSLGSSSQAVQKGVSMTRPFKHRLELKTDCNGIYTLDDSYNGNPDGVEAAITFLACLKGHRRFYVTPGLVEMGPSTESVHVEIGKRLASAGIEKVVLIKDSVTSYIEIGLRQAKYSGDVIWFDEALKAYAALSHMTVKGDVVLLQNDWPDQYA